MNPPATTSISPTPARRRSPGLGWTLALTVVGWLFCLGRPAALADPTAPPPPAVHARLISDHATIAPGQTFRLAVLFDIPRHWHIYWRNPGDSGMPTSVQLTCPARFTAQPFAYPLPIRFNQPGGLHAFGYENQVMLIARVTAPADLSPGQTVRFQSRAEWLACRDICVPGGDQPALDLPVASKPRPAADPVKQLFDRYADRLPAATGTLDSPIAAVVTVPEHLGKTDRLEINLLWRRNVEVLDFLAVPDDKVILEKPAIDHHDKQTRITVKVLILPSRSPKAGPLPALVLYRDAQGRTRGVNITVKLPPPP